MYVIITKSWVMMLLHLLLHVMIHKVLKFILLLIHQFHTWNRCINYHGYYVTTQSINQDALMIAYLQKGSVFKKFDENNLFQLSCTDVPERFHLMMLLLAVILQTMKEYAWKTDRSAVLFPDCVYLSITEVMVDWMGRPALVSDEKVVSILEKYIEFFKEDNFPSIRHSVYQQISTDLDGAWKPRTVYNHIRENKKNHLQKARENSGVVTVSSSSSETAKHCYEQLGELNRTSLMNEQSFDSCRGGNQDNSTCDFDDGVHSLENEYNKSDQPEFDLSLSPTEWEKLKPSVDASESQVRRLRPRVWANVLTHAIWKRHAFKCAFNAVNSYLRPQKSESGDGFYFSFKLCCKSVKCSNQVIGFGEKKLVDGGVCLKFKCNDTRDSLHEEVKRPLNGIDRTMTGQQLLKRRAALYRDELLQKHVKFGQSIPYFIQNPSIYMQYPAIA